MHTMTRTQQPKGGARAHACAELAGSPPEHSLAALGIAPGNDESRDSLRAKEDEMSEEKCDHGSTPLRCHECTNALVMTDPVARAAYWQNRCERHEAALSAIAEAVAPEVPVLDRHTLQFVRDRARF